MTRRDKSPGSLSYIISCALILGIEPILLLL